MCLSGFDFSKSCSELCCFCLTCWSLAESNACSAKCYLALLHGILGYAHEVPALQPPCLGLLSVRKEISLEFLNFSIRSRPRNLFFGSIPRPCFCNWSKKGKKTWCRHTIFYLSYIRSIPKPTVHGRRLLLNRKAKSSCLSRNIFTERSESCLHWNRLNLARNFL